MGMDLDHSMTAKKFWHRFVAVVLGSALALGAAPGLESAQAAQLTSTLWLTEKYPLSLYDKVSTIEIKHPKRVFCNANTSCYVDVQARFTNTKPASSPTIDLITNLGTKIASDWMSSYQGTNWQTLSFYGTFSSNTEVTFNIQSSTLYSSDAQRYFTSVITGPTPDAAFYFDNPSSDSVTNWQSYNFLIGQQVIFAGIIFPLEAQTSSTCLTIPVAAAPLDVVTGKQSGIDTSGLVSVQAGFSIDGERVDSVFFGGSGNPWSSSRQTESSVELCGLNPQSGRVTNVTVVIEATYKDDSYSKTSAGSYDMSVVGSSVYTTINCLKGKTVRVVTAARPVCPAGYAKTSLKVVNGKLAPTSITCVKGFLVKRVTGVLPSCPAGYRRK